MILKDGSKGCEYFIEFTFKLILLKATPKSPKIVNLSVEIYFNNQTHNTLLQNY